VTLGRARASTSGVPAPGAGLAASSFHAQEDTNQDQRREEKRRRHAGSCVPASAVCSTPGIDKLGVTGSSPVPPTSKTPASPGVFVSFEVDSEAILVVFGLGSSGGLALGSAGCPPAPGREARTQPSCFGTT
jgi:hypothetical protein